MAHDPVLGKGALRENLFTHNVEFHPDKVPYWKKDGFVLGNGDMNHIRNYIERLYGINAPKKIDDALVVEATANSYHPVQDYIRSQVWDGVPRVDTMLIDILGAEDNLYTREAMRIMLVGAVNRIFKAGCKFDTAMILVGGQGVGKSTFINRLANGWFSDSIEAVGNVRSQEAIQGVWLIELAELAAVKNSETNAVKSFLSSTSDRFRGAYKEKTEDYPRQCVFFGTTNDAAFLQDRTGNRRFLPIEVKKTENTHKMFEPEYADYIAQVWAEAYEMYRNKVSLLLSDEAEAIANQARKAYVPVGTFEDEINTYVNMDVPTNWYEMDSTEHAIYFAAYPNSKQDYTDFMKREYVTLKEVCIECMGYSAREVNKKVTKEAEDAMLQLEGWTNANSLDRPQTTRVLGRLINLRGAFWRE